MTVTASTISFLSNLALGLSTSLKIWLMPALNPTLLKRGTSEGGEVAGFGFIIARERSDASSVMSGSFAWVEAEMSFSGAAIFPV